MGSSTLIHPDPGKNKHRLAERLRYLILQLWRESVCNLKPSRGSPAEAEEFNLSAPRKMNFKDLCVGES